MMRRFAFAFIPVFVSSNAEGSLQASIAQLVAIGLLVATAIARPFATTSDNALEIMSHLIINVLILSGSTVTWASNISERGLRALAAVQLMLSSVIVFIAVASVAQGVSVFIRKTRQKRAEKKEYRDGRDGNIVRVHVSAAGSNAEETS